MPSPSLNNRVSFEKNQIKWIKHGHADLSQPNIFDPNVLEDPQSEQVRSGVQGTIYSSSTIHSIVNPPICSIYRNCP